VVTARANAGYVPLVLSKWNLERFAIQKKTKNPKSRGFLRLFTMLKAK
jgi:hypothetical protein